MNNEITKSNGIEPIKAIIGQALTSLGEKITATEEVITKVRGTRSNAKQAMKPFLIQPNKIAITNEIEQKKIASIIVNVKEGQKLIEEQRKVYAAPLTELAKKINAKFKTESIPLDELKTILGNGYTEYQLKIEREEREKENERLRKIAELEKQKQEALSKAEESPEAIQEAEKLEEEITSTFVNTEPVEKTIHTKMGKVTTRTKWIGTVTNKENFLRYCLKYNNLELIEFNSGNINRFAMLKKNTETIPGLEIVETKSI